MRRKFVLGFALLLVGLGLNGPTASAAGDPWRVEIDARLDVLEVQWATPPPLVYPSIDHWIKQRATTLESVTGLPWAGPQPPVGVPFRDWMFGRVEALELVPLLGPVYAHLSTQYGIEYGTETQERIDAGWATGTAIYWKTMIDYGPKIKTVVDLFAPEGVDLLLMPKEYNEASVRAVMAQMSVAQRAKVVYAHFQEPENDLFTPEAKAQYRADVIASCAVMHELGAKCGVEVMSWTLNPENPKEWAGEATLLEFISPEVAAVIDTVGWSFFPNGTPSLMADLDRVGDFMDVRFPGMAWGGASVGVGVPIGTPVHDPLRQQRASLVAAFYEELRDRGGSHGSWYDHPESFMGDMGVDDELLPVLRGVNDLPY
jgi:hypothetical protein